MSYHEMNLEYGALEIKIKSEVLVDPKTIERMKYLAGELEKISKSFVRLPADWPPCH
jgi:hypothetical protein